jgi:hypothetical protein
VPFPLYDQRHYELRQKPENSVTKGILKEVFVILGNMEMMTPKRKIASTMPRYRHSFKSGNVLKYAIVPEE